MISYIKNYSNLFLIYVCKTNLSYNILLKKILTLAKKKLLKNIVLITVITIIAYKLKKW